MKAKIDKTIIGFFIGVLIPILAFVLLYIFKYNYYSIEKYIEFASYPINLLRLLKICVFAQLPFFFVGNMLQMFRFCKGIFIASLIYIAIMSYFNFIR